MFFKILLPSEKLNVRKKCIIIVNVVWSLYSHIPSDRHVLSVVEFFFQTLNLIKILRSFHHCVPFVYTLPSNCSSLIHLELCTWYLCSVLISSKSMLLFVFVLWSKGIDISVVSTFVFKWNINFVIDQTV